VHEVVPTAETAIGTRSPADRRASRSRSTCPNRPVRFEVPPDVIRHTARRDRTQDRLRQGLYHNQDLTAQRDGLAALGVDGDRIYVDHGLTGTTRARPGLREVLAACRTGDTLAVTKLDRLARSLPDARDIVEELTTRGVHLQLGGSVHDPTDPVGRLLFNVLAMVAEFESDLIKARTREGLAVARAAGKLRGRKPKLTPTREALLVDLHRTGQKSPGATAPWCVGSAAVSSGGGRGGRYRYRLLRVIPVSVTIWAIECPASRKCTA